MKSFGENFKVILTGLIIICVAIAFLIGWHEILFKYNRSDKYINEESYHKGYSEALDTIQQILNEHMRNVNEDGESSVITRIKMDTLYYDFSDIRTKYLPIKKTD
jgi:hypothetical protein